MSSPALGSIRGDLLKGNFQYVDGYFAIQDMEFKQRNSTYQLQGVSSKNPARSARRWSNCDSMVDNIQDILVALQIFELTDLSRIFRRSQL